MRAGLARLVATLSVLLVVACGGGGGTDPAVSPGVATIEIPDGDGQSGFVATPLSAPLVARLLDADGRPVPGQAVQFVVTDGGGTVSPVTAFTDTAGRASTTWTLGRSVGEAQRVEARIVDAQGRARFVKFAATPLPSPLWRVEVVQGANQSAIQGETLPLPITYVFRDASDMPLPGIRVALSVGTGGSVTPSEAVTDSEGRVSVTWRLAPRVARQWMTLDAGGRYWTVASAEALMASTVPVTTGPASAITVVSGDAQSLVQHGVLAAPLVVRVTDAAGHGVPDLPVVFVLADGAAGFPPVSVTTSARSVDGGGYARLSNVGIHTAGDLHIEARVAGLPAATFNLHVDPNPHRFDGVYRCSYDTVPGFLEIIVMQGYPTTRFMLDPLTRGRPLSFVGLLDEASGLLVASYRAGQSVTYELSATVIVDDSAVARMTGSYIRGDSSDIAEPTTGAFACLRY